MYLCQKRKRKISEEECRNTEERLGLDVHRLLISEGWGSLHMSLILPKVSLSVQREFFLVAVVCFGLVVSVKRLTIFRFLTVHLS